MAIQSMILDPNAVAYTDNEIIGKVNTATVNISRALAVESAAVDLSGKDADDLAESVSKKWAGVTGADFIKSTDTLDEIIEGTIKKHFTAIEQVKLGDVEKDAKDLQVISSWVASTVYALGDVIEPVTPNGYKYICTVAGTSDTTEPTWGTIEGGEIVDATVTWTCWKYAASTVDADKLIDGVTNKAFTATEDTKLVGIEDNAKDDQSGAEVRDIIVALADSERKIIISSPITGEFTVIDVHRNADGKLDVKYDDVVIP